METIRKHHHQTEPKPRNNRDFHRTYRGETSHWRTHSMQGSTPESHWQLPVILNRARHHLPRKEEQEEAGSGQWRRRPGGESETQPEPWRTPPPGGESGANHRVDRIAHRFRPRTRKRLARKNWRDKPLPRSLPLPLFQNQEGPWVAGWLAGVELIKSESRDIFACTPCGPIALSKFNHTNQRKPRIHNLGQAQKVWREVRKNTMCTN